jgi:hypothetical protein
LDALLDSHPAAAWSAEADRSELAELAGPQDARTMRFRRDAPLREKFVPKAGRIDEYSLMIEGKENDDVASKNPR